MVVQYALSPEVVPCVYASKLKSLADKDAWVYQKLLVQNRGKKLLKRKQQQQTHGRSCR